MSTQPLENVYFPHRRILHGRSWSAPSGVRPAIRCAMEIQDPARLARRKIRHRLWAMESALTPGQETSFQENLWHSLTPGLVHLYRPGAVYKERLVSSSDPVRVVFVLFEGGELMGLPKLLPPGSCWLRIRDSAGLVSSLLRRMAMTSPGESSDCFWAAQAGLMEACQHLLQSLPGSEGDRIVEAKGAHPAPPSLAEKVHHFLEKNFARPLKLADVARNVSVSISSLSHGYREETGETARQTLLRIRMEKAAGLLIAGWPVKTVCAQVGFPDAFHFSRVFKQWHGSPPSHFARLSR